MNPRKPFRWKCTLLSTGGQQAERQFSSFWSPEKVSAESVAQACAAQESAATKGKTRYAGLSAVLVG